MFYSRQNVIALSLLCSLFTITACGGGGGGSDGGTTSPPPPPVNNAPTASNVVITDDNGGDTVTGDTLTATYTYSDAENDPEGASSFQWRRDGADISGANSLSYTLNTADEGTQISIQITPIASSGTSNGESVVSSAISAIAPVVTGPDKTEFMNSLSSWSEFAPKERPVSEEGKEVVNTETTPVVEEVEDEQGLVKVCTTESVDFFKSPEEYVMFAPPTNILYPGAFVEGKSLRDGASAGDILPLNIQQRTQVTVSIPACSFENNFRVVAPNQANVNSAVGAIIDEASRIGLNCVQPRGNLKVETYRNDQQRAMSAGFSGRYFGFSGSASGSYSKSTTQNSVAAVFRETLYTVQIEAPQTPGDWFTDEFTPERIKELEDAGRLSDTNIPAYVAQVTYGRILTSTFTSSYSESDMRAAIEFKYSNPAVDVKGDAAVRSQTIRENSSTTIAYLGGSAEATTAMLRSNDWTEYFSAPVTAADAVPISFELRSTSDNTLAVTQELTSYDRTTCVDRVADNATFNFQAKESFTPDFTGTGQVTAFGDIDGDGADDLVWANTNANGLGEFAVALSEKDGSFATLLQDININASGKTGQLRLFIADIDNDGREDVILSIMRGGSGGNTLYVSFYKDTENDQQAFVHSSEQDIARGSGGWETYTPFIGQMDKANGIDFVYNNVLNNRGTNRTYIAHSVDTTTDNFDLSTEQLFVRTSAIDDDRNFNAYEYIFIDDFDGDGHDDIGWQLLLPTFDVSSNAIYYRYGTPTGLTDFDIIGQGSTWGVYTTLHGDINGNGRADIVYPRQGSLAENFAIYTRPGSPRKADGFEENTITFYNDPVDHAVLQPFFGASVEIEPDLYLGDVNGDGADDFIVNEKGVVDPLSNNVAVGLSVPNSVEFTFSREAQRAPQSEDWSLYSTYIADINGDERQDIIWVRIAASNDVIVGIARGD